MLFVGRYSVTGLLWVLDPDLLVFIVTLCAAAVLYLFLRLRHKYWNVQLKVVFDLFVAIILTAVNKRQRYP